MKTHIASLVILLFLSAACKRQKVSKVILEPKENPDVVIKSDSTNTTIIDTAPADSKIYTPVRVDSVNFNYINLKSKLNYKDESNDQSATATFHIKKDSAIWFSVNIILVEGARGVITKDSIHFFSLNPKKFKREYYDLSLDSLSRKYNFDLRFELLQSLLVGNMPVAQNDEDSVHLNSEAAIILQKLPPILIENYISSVNNKLKTLIAKPENGTDNMTIDYADFIAISQNLFPQRATLNINSQKNGKTSNKNISLWHTKVEFLDNNPGFYFKRK